MTSESCGHVNPPGARFCTECGTALPRACSGCGGELPERAKFCPACALPVAPAAGVEPRFASPQSYTPRHLAEKILTTRHLVEGERKHVTVLFADLKDSMELLGWGDPEDAQRLLEPVLERMIEAVHRYEGTVNQVMGDGVMALFGAPVAHEDHALRACYAALRMQATVRQYAESLRHRHELSVQIRVGLNSGEVVVGAIGSDLRMEYTAVGQITHVAARMEQMAAPGTILIPVSTLKLVEGYVDVEALGARPVKGLTAPMEVYEVTGAGRVRSRLHAVAARGLTQFVGRDDEVRTLTQALDRARAGHGQIVAVVGEPGVGKSRLFWEFTHSPRTRGCLVIESVSVSYGKATAYLPVIEVLKTYFKIELRDDPRTIRDKVTDKLRRTDASSSPTRRPSSRS